MSTDETTLLAMMKMAIDQRKTAYAPYSGFQVGAAVRGGSGRVYGGSNVENASYGLTVCAERVAILKAVSEGEREISTVVVCAPSHDREKEDCASPCGACLQVMAEFAPKNEPLVIITCSPDGTYKQALLDDYLPKPFRFVAGK